MEIKSKDSEAWITTDATSRCLQIMFPKDEEGPKQFLLLHHFRMGGERRSEEAVEAVKITKTK
jgi:hypothetical protein